jgi:hypothetical protein
MTAKFATILIAISMLVGAALVISSHVYADSGNRPRRDSELADAARETYKCTDAEYQAGNATVEDLYRWSLRLMRAEQKDGVATAAADHAARMKALHDKIAALHAVGAIGASSKDFNATKFYHLEAESIAKP